tara:strand:- start:310 stop:525 length:216 start_codon:yes stop_codon:yes gene_type:complete
MPSYTPTAEQALAMKFGLIRDRRNQLLAETDWWAVPDRTMTTAQTNYRQNLRDLPASNADPDQVTFPTKPS